MATAKQYELLFLLKAQMDSALGSSFTGVQKYVAGLQGKLKDYNQTLRDISAYQAQTQKIEELTQKYQSEGKSITEIDELLEKKKQKLAETAEALDKAGVSTENLAEEEQKLKQAAQETTEEMEKWAGLQNTVTDFANTFAAMMPVADTIVNAVKGIDSAIMSCIDSAAQLQYTMSAVTAISGATEEEAVALTVLAKETGATTIYTAEQAAQALETMGLAGMDASEMMSGLPAVVSLAAASGEDLTQMCSIVSDALNAFGLSGTKAVNEFADTLAKAATSSNTTVSVLGESLSYVEGTAANLGYSIQDVSVALAQMANNALKGSVSGSALNTMLTRMSGANSTAADEMDALNLSMYNADGSAKELSVFLDELRTAFQGFGDDAQAAQVAAYKLAGQRGMRGLLSIVQASDEEWQKLTEEIYAYDGAASTISDIRLDNYTGQIYLLESAWDALKTTVGEAFLPVATDSAEVLTDLTNKMNDLASEHQDLIVAMSAGITTFGAVAAGITVIGTAAQAARFALQTMSIEMAPLVAAAGWIGIAAAGIGMLAVGIYNSATSIEGVSDSILELKTDVDSLQESTDSAIESWEETGSTYDEQRDKASGLISTLENLQGQNQDDILTQKETAAVVEQLNELLPNLNLEYDALSGTLSSTTDEMREFANAVTDDEVNDALAQLASLEAQQAEVEQKLAEAKAEYEKALSHQSEAGGNPYTPEAMSAAKDVQQAVLSVADLQEQYDNLSAAVTEAKDKTSEYVQEQYEAADASGLTAAQQTALTDAVTEYEKVWGEAYNTVYEALQGQIDLFSEANEVTKTSTDELFGNLESQYEQLKNYQENLQTLADAGITFPEGMWAQLTDGSSEAQGAVAALAKDVKDNNTSAVESVINKWNEVASLVETTSGTAANTLEDVQTALDGVVETIDFDGEELREQAITIGGNVISGLAAGIEEGGTEVNGSAKQATDDMIEAIRIAAGTHSASTITTEIGQDVDQGLIDGMEEKKEAINQMAEDISDAAIDGFTDKLKYETFKSYGSNAIQGAIDGATEKKKNLIDTYTALAQAASNAYASALDINSPSKVFHWFGEMSAEGSIQAADENQGRVSAAYAELAQAASAAYSDGYIDTRAETIMIDPLAMGLLNQYSSRHEEAVRPLTTTTYSTVSSETKEPVQLIFSPNITVSGNSGITVEEIKQQLQEQAGEMYSVIERYLQQREERNRRRVR
ncbi:MAG: phage tail tape measure protein [Clostridia bacterium]|nr:phage tail tape measure protein [Clostridia bacterium]